MQPTWYLKDMDETIHRQIDIMNGTDVQFKF